jgi:uncharacterized protein (TIGR02996 family)
MDLLAQHEAFLRAIFDAPDDDTPRLVYADFLQENGEDVRAEFIRVQCELASKRGQAEHFERVWQLEAREHELIWRLEPDLAYLQPWQRNQNLPDRGFRSPGMTFVLIIESLSDTIAARWHTVRREPEQFGARNLAIEPGRLLSPEHIELLFALPAAHRITEWLLDGFVREELGHNGPGAFDLIDLVQRPTITTAGVAALAAHRGASRLTRLDLRNNDLDNDAARLLVDSPFLGNLKRLRLLEGNRLRGMVWQRVIERFGEDVVE